MELGLGNAACRSIKARQPRMNRAQWWFEQMRRAVEQAVDWKPRPESNREWRQPLLTSKN